MNIIRNFIFLMLAVVITACDAGAWGFTPKPQTTVTTAVTTAVVVDDNQAQPIAQTPQTNVMQSTTKPSWCDNGGLNSTESTICGNNSLWAWDAQMNNIYQQSNPRGQGKWRIKNRDACGDDVQCIAQSYQNRLSVIQGGGTMTTQSTSGGQVPTWCSNGNPKTPVENMICSNQNIASMDAIMGNHWKSQGNQWRKNNLVPQKQFLTLRNQCVDVACLTTVYTARLAELRLNSNMGTMSTQPITEQPLSTGVISFDLDKNRISRTQLVDIVKKFANEYSNVPPVIVFAIIATHGKASASNPMKVSQGTATNHSCGDISTIDGNVDCGFKILSALIKTHGQNASTVVAAYLTGSPSMSAGHSLYNEYLRTMGALMLADAILPK